MGGNVNSSCIFLVLTAYMAFSGLCYGEKVVTVLRRERYVKVITSDIVAKTKSQKSGKLCIVGCFRTLIIRFEQLGFP